MLLMKWCSIFHVKMQYCFQISRRKQNLCTMVILHCLNTRLSLPDASTTIVTSKVIRHKCISSTCLILQGYTLHSFVQHWCWQQNAPSRFQQHRSEYGGVGGGEICTVIHCFKGCDTTNEFVSQKGLSYSVDRERSHLVHPNS